MNGGSTNFMGLSRIVLSILILCVPARVMASDCERQARPPSVEEKSYLGLLEKSVQKQAVLEEDLHWLRGQEKPANPVRFHSKTENIGVYQGFRRILKKLRVESWPYLVEGIDRILARKSVESEAVEQARKDSFNILNWKPRQVKAVGGIPYPTFVSSKREVFYPQVKDQGTLITELNSTTETTIPEFYLSLIQGDLWESSKGEVFFAAIASEELRVVNVRTGVERGKIPFSKIPEIMAINPSFRNFSPILFEREGKIKVAIVPWGSGISDQVVDHQTVAIFDVESGTHKVRKFPNGKFGFKRFPDGHVYVYGYPTSRGATPSRILVHDVTMNDRVLTLDGVTGFQDEMIPYLYFDQSRKPQLVLNSVEGTPCFLNQTTKMIEPMKSMKSVSPFNIILTTGPTGEAWIIALSRDDSSKFHFIYGPPDNWKSHKSVALELMPTNDGGNFNSLAEIDGPLGRMITFKEEGSGQMLHALYAFEIRGGNFLNLQLSEPMGIQSSRPFVNPQDRSILLFVRKPGEIWELMQFYGPP